jgi:hypothetical protein
VASSFLGICGSPKEPSRVGPLSGYLDMYGRCNLIGPQHLNRTIILQFYPAQN